MNIKLISANFHNHKKLVYQGTDKDVNLNIDFFNYDDTNFPLRNNSLHPRLKGKIPKMLGWMYDNEKEYDYYIWADSKFTITNQGIPELIRQIKNFDICLFKHPHRHTLLSEYNYIIQKMGEGDRYLIDRYNGENLQQQIKDYFSDKDFNDNELFACGLFIYSNRLIKDKEYNLLKEWYFHNSYYSIQDQLSLPYLLQKLKINHTTFNFNIFHNPFVLHNNG
jgi:hypothetical protein